MLRPDPNLQFQCSRRRPISGSRSNLDYLPIFDLPAQVKRASFCAEVITAWARSELASAATQLTKSPCFFTPTAQFAIRSEIVQPFGNRVLATPESQPSMTTVALRLEFGHASQTSPMPSWSASA